MSAPLFDLLEVEFRPRGSISHFQTADGHVVIALDRRSVLRFSLDDAANMEEVQLRSEGNSASSSEEEGFVRSLFLDPTGHHLIVCMSNGKHCYLHKNAKFPSSLNLMKGGMIESVGWNKDGTSEHTGEILIGTEGGRIYGSALQAGKADVALKRLYCIEGGGRVSGLWWEVHGRMSKRYLIVATTPTRVYTFVGTQSLQNVFESYRTTPEFYEMPLSGPDRDPIGRLSVCLAGKNRPLPQDFFCWCTEIGLYYGELLRWKVAQDEDIVGSVISQPHLIPFTTIAISKGEVGSEGEFPESFLLLEHHIVVLYVDTLIIFSRLTQKVVHKERLEDEMVGLVKDSRDDSVWVFGKSQVYELCFSDETRDVWLEYLEMQKFELAEKYCHTDQQCDAVWCVEADKTFQSGHRELAAAMYARVKGRSFEEVALQFLDCEAYSALNAYVQQVKQRMQAEDQWIQLTMLCTWLVQLYVRRICALRVRDEVSKLTLEEIDELSAKDEGDSKLVLTLEDFRQFLSANKEYMDGPTVLNLLQSTGWADLMIFYAEEIHMAGFLIMHFLTLPQVDFVVGEEKSRAEQREEVYRARNQSCLRALSILVEEKCETLYYEFATLFIECIPYETIKAWIDASDILDPCKLLPALSHCNPAKYPPSVTQNQVIRYLEYCIGSTESQDVRLHNFLLLQYVNENDDGKSLMGYLKWHKDGRYHFNTAFAIRTLKAAHQRLAVVELLWQLGRHDEALQVALEVGLDFALDIVGRSEDSHFLGRAYQRIVKEHIARGDTARALAVMNLDQVTKFVSIEDILHEFAAGTVSLGDLSGVMCSALEAYHRQVIELKKVMESHADTAALIRQDAEQHEYASTTIDEGNQYCTSCKKLLLNHALYLYPCSHAFHCDCRVKEEMKLVGPTRCKILKRLCGQMMGVKGEEEWSNMKAQLDEMVVRGCPLCSKSAILLVSEPLISDVEAMEWKV